MGIRTPLRYNPNKANSSRNSLPGYVENAMQLKGVVETGVGQGAFFTSLAWVREQFQEKGGFIPFPGTLNVRICAEDLPGLQSFTSATDFEITPDDPQFCSGAVKRIWIEGIPATAVFPGERVRVHPKEVIEIVSDRNLKEALHLKDGDRVTISDIP